MESFNADDATSDPTPAATTMTTDLDMTVSTDYETEEREESPGEMVRAVTKVECNVKVEMDWQEEEEPKDDQTPEDSESNARKTEEQARSSNLRVQLEDVIEDIQTGKYGTVKVARLARRKRMRATAAAAIAAGTKTKRKRKRHNRQLDHQCTVAGCRSRVFAVQRFCIPSTSRNKEQRRLWIEALRMPASWEPKHHDRVCSDHFLSGQPSATRLDPDYVPSIFPWNDKKRPRTAKEIKEYEEMKRKIRKDVEEVIKKKLLTLPSPVTLPAAMRFAERRGCFDNDDDEPAEKKSRFLSLKNSSSGKAAWGQAKVQVAAERARSKDVMDIVKLREKQLEDITTKFNDYRVSFSKMLKENTSLKQKVTFLEQRLIQSEATNKQMMTRCDELSAHRDKKVKMSFRGTQTRVVDHEEDSAVFSDDERVEMAPVEWVRHLKRQYCLTSLPERKAMERKEAEEKGELETYLRRVEERKEMYKKMRTERLKGTTTRTVVVPSSSSSASQPKRLLQSVDPTKVPDSVKLAVQNMLLKGSLQPVKVQTVPVAVQRAVSQMMLQKGAPTTTQQQQVMITKLDLTSTEEEDEIGGQVAETVLVLEEADEPLRTPIHVGNFD